VALVGCGEDGGTQASDDTSSPASPSASDKPSNKPSKGAPDCTAVWKDNGELPRSYDGCNSDEGFVASDTLGCSSGQRMVRYGDHFYAVPGGTIHGTESLLEDDRGYRAAVASCRA
jgi:hypothetical protein